MIPAILWYSWRRIIQSYLHNTVRLSDGREGEVVMINKLSYQDRLFVAAISILIYQRNKDLTIDSIL